MGSLGFVIGIGGSFLGTDGPCFGRNTGNLPPKGMNVPDFLSGISGGGPF